MNNIIKSRIATIALSLGALSLPVAAHSEVHSKSRMIVVVEPRDLPAPAREAGEAIFLHSDNSGSTYLYLEQQNGARLAVFDVSDPAHITLSSTVALEGSGVFDVERSLGPDAELIRYRNGHGAAVLDLHKAKHPALHATAVLSTLSHEEPLGYSALLAESYPTLARPAIEKDVQIIDTSVATNPVLLTTVSNVEHRISFDETGTTFLLGNTGLTVIRRTDIEEAHQIHEIQMHGN